MKTLIKIAGLLVVLLSLTFLAGCGQSAKSEFDTGAAQYRNLNSVDAVKHLRRAIAIEPEFVPAYLLMGRIAAGEKDDESAPINYRNAYDIVRKRGYQLQEEDVRVKEDPNLRLEWQEAASYLADAEFKNENYNRAQFYYDAILEHSATSAWMKRAHDGKQIVGEFFTHRKNLQALRQQNISHPEDPRVKAELAALFMEMASGLSRLQKLEVVADFIAASNEWRGQAKALLDELYDASPEVRLTQTEALLDYTESQEALMRGHFDRSIEKVKEASEKDPKEARYKFAVASILRVVDSQNEESNEYTDEILKYAKEATELDPTVWRYLVFYAGLVQEMGDLEESYRVLNRVTKITRDEAVLKEVSETLAALEAAIEAQKSESSTSE
jgi:Flp pilus assembly protein TadD